MRLDRPQFVSVRPAWHILGLISTAILRVLAESYNLATDAIVFTVRFIPFTRIYQSIIVINEAETVIPVDDAALSLKLLVLTGLYGGLFYIFSEQFTPSSLVDRFSPDDLNKYRTVVAFGATLFLISFSPTWLTRLFGSPIEGIQYSLVIGILYYGIVSPITFGALLASTQGKALQQTPDLNRSPFDAIAIDNGQLFSPNSSAFGKWFSIGVIYTAIPVGLGAVSVVLGFFYPVPEIAITVGLIISLILTGDSALAELYDIQHRLNKILGTVVVYPQAMLVNGAIAGGILTTVLLFASAANLFLNITGNLFDMFTLWTLVGLATSCVAAFAYSAGFWIRIVRRYPYTLIQSDLFDTRTFDIDADLTSAVPAAPPVIDITVAVVLFSASWYVLSSVGRSSIMNVRPLFDLLWLPIVGWLSYRGLKLLGTVERTPSSDWLLIGVSLCIEMLELAVWLEYNGPSALLQPEVITRYNPIPAMTGTDTINIGMSYAGNLQDVFFFWLGLSLMIISTYPTYYLAQWLRSTLDITDVHINPCILTYALVTNLFGTSLLYMAVF